MTPSAKSEIRIGSLFVLGLVTFILSSVGWFAAWVLVPTLLGWQSSVVISGSMMPSIHPGDVVLSPPYDHRLRAGEVVTFSSTEVPGETVTHRLVRQNADHSWVTQGDANATPDIASLRDSGVLGKPSLLIPYAGTLTFWRYSGQNTKLAGTAIGLTLLLAFAVSTVGRRHDSTPLGQEVVLDEVAAEPPSLADSSAQ